MAVFVDNLPWTTSSEDLQVIYRDYKCTSAIVQTRNSGKSCGYGVVRFETRELAEAAIEATNGSELGGRQIQARLDKFS